MLFKQPKEVNKLHITKRDLSERLLLCLTCNRKFVPYLIPQLLDKFESPLEEVKTYCYETLNAILVDGDFKIFAKNMVDFWNLIKFDCLKRKYKSNLEVQSYIENCLRRLTNVYSADNDQIRKWFKMIINDLEACLFNLDLNCYLSSTATLSILAASYPKYFSTISRLLISNAIHNYKSNEDPKRRIEALQSLYIFGEELDKVNDFELVQNEFNEHQILLSKVSQEKIEQLAELENSKSVFDHLVCFLFKLILDKLEIDDDERLNCLYTLRRIISLNFVAYDQVLLNKYLDELFKVIKNHQQIDYSTALFSILEHFNKSNCKLVQQSLIPNILKELNSASPVYFIKLLEFCTLTIEQEKQFIKYSLNKLKSQSSVAKLVESIGNTLKCHIQKSNDSLLTLFFDDLMQPLVDSILKEICSNKTVINNQEIVFELINDVCRQLDDEKAKQIQTFIFVLFTSNESSGKQVPKNCFLNFEISLNNDNLLFLKLMESMLLGLKINSQDKEELKMVYTKLFDKLIVTKDLTTFQTLINLIEICTAKFEHTKPMINSLSYINDVYENQALRIRYLLVKFYVSIMKSFITIGNEQSLSIVKKLVTVLMKEKNLDICKQVIVGIKYIHDLDLKLTEANHVNCKSFLNQRFYYLIIPLLLKEYNYLETEDALNNLTLIESEEQSKDEYRKLIKQDSQASPTKKAYLRKETDSFVVKMITNIETKIATEKVNENHTTSSNSSPVTNAKKVKIMVDETDPIKHSLNLRKNLISNAIILQISRLPKPMIKIELKKLQKIIQHNSLNLSMLADCDVLIANQIDFIKLILEFNSKLLEDRILNLINLLLEYGSLKESNMHVKCKILNCLELMAINLNPIELIKFKQDVINRIRMMLDHKKRLVRYAAVNSINKWTVIGQPV